MSNGEFQGNWPRKGPQTHTAGDVFAYGAPPFEPTIPPFVPAPAPPWPFDGTIAFQRCTACSDSRIFWGPDGPSPCPRCCEKLIEALVAKAAKEKSELDRDASVWRSEARSILSLRREIDRLKAKCNRLLRKLRGVK